MRDACPSLSITFKMFGWTKWGGATSGLFTLLPADEWFCQNCGDKQTRNMPAYMVPMDLSGRNFAKICVLCRAEFIFKEFTVFYELKSPKRL